MADQTKKRPLEQGQSPEKSAKRGALLEEQGKGTPLLVKVNRLTMESMQKPPRVIGSDSLASSVSGSAESSPLASPTKQNTKTVLGADLSVGVTSNTITFTNTSKSPTKSPTKSQTAAIPAPASETKVSVSKESENTKKDVPTDSKSEIKKGTDKDESNTTNPKKQDAVKQTDSDKPKEESSNGIKPSLLGSFQKPSQQSPFQMHNLESSSFAKFKDNAGFGMAVNSASKVSFSQLLSGNSQDLGEKAQSELEKEKKVSVAQVNVVTGEEDEELVYSTRCKLFHMQDEQWKERGVGILKISKISPGKYRLVALARRVPFSKYLVRLKNAEIASKLEQELKLVVEDSK